MLRGRCAFSHRVQVMKEWEGDVGGCRVVVRYCATTCLQCCCCCTAACAASMARAPLYCRLSALIVVHSPALRCWERVSVGGTIAWTHIARSPKPVFSPSAVYSLLVLGVPPFVAFVLVGCVDCEATSARSKTRIGGLTARTIAHSRCRWHSCETERGGEKAKDDTATRGR